MMKNSLVAICIAAVAVGMANAQGHCGNCNATGHGAECNVPSVQTCVCASDEYCCNVEWDDVCVMQVASVCGVDCHGAGVCPFQMDGNHEVLFPPLIDEHNTHVVFKNGAAYMRVTILVPKQYSTAKFDFEDATDNSATYDSTINALTNQYWNVDEVSDFCKVTYTAEIPWMAFRTTLGGITEETFPDAVYYRTAINIEVSKNLTLAPETLLLSKDVGLLDAGHYQEHVRYVRNQIPFEVKFNTALKLWDRVDVTSDHLRVAAAIVDSTVLNVDPNFTPMGKGQIDFITVIPLPLVLESPTITVDNDALERGITIEEYEPRRNCSDATGFCTQFWHVMIYPETCTLDGQYVANFTGACHPDATNCNPPSPDFAEIVMDVTSDNFCGVTQRVQVTGTLSLESTFCNEIMRGSVKVSSPQGAAINHTEITKVEVSPTLKGNNELIIFQGPTSLLNYSATLVTPSQIDFEFLWVAKELRCDVIASIDVMVMVEFDATRSPQVLSLRSAGTASLSGWNDLRDRKSKAVSTKRAELQQRQSSTDDYEMRMLSHTQIVGANRLTPDDAEEVGDVSGAGSGDGATTAGNSNAEGTAASTTTSVSTAIIVLCVMVGLIVAVCVGGGIYVLCARRAHNKRAEFATGTSPVAPRDTPTGRGHKRGLSAAVLNRVRAVDEMERAPLTPQGQDHFFHDE